MTDLDEARETIKKLNRRCQLMESGLVDAARCIQHLAGGNPWCGGNLGRAFLAAHGHKTNEAVKSVSGKLGVHILGLQLGDPRSAPTLEQLQMLKQWLDEVTL